MDRDVCGILISISNSISKNLDKNKNYQIVINGSTLNGYCSGNSCDNDLDKINAGCLYLFDSFFGSSSVFNSVAKSNINIVEYIIIWLSYMLSLKDQVGNNTNLQYFYNTTIKNDKYQKSIAGVEQYYKNYKDLIDKKTNLINMDMKIVPKLYEAFSKLCMMHFEFDKQNPQCEKYLKEAKEFVEKYKKLKDDSNINKKSPYDQLLSTLLNDYNNFIDKCNGVNCSNSSSFPTIEKVENYVQGFGDDHKHTVQKLEQISEDPSSSSSIASKLFIVLSIFGAIAFFLGISYKYSLFGFRKRIQKQYLREKIKSIKKRMNH